MCLYISSCTNILQTKHIFYFFLGVSGTKPLTFCLISCPGSHTPVNVQEKPPPVQKEENLQLGSGQLRLQKMEQSLLQVLEP